MKRTLLMLGLLAAAVVPARAQVSGVTVDLTMSQTQYLPAEDLQLNVNITNRSGQAVTFGQDNQWITFSIVGQKGDAVPQAREMPAAGEFTLQSGQSTTRSLSPTPYFDFRNPGRYRIGAVVKIAQWGREVVCRPIFFVVTDATPLPDFNELPIGVPPAPGASNALPEVRHYSLIRVAYLEQLMLYFRLTDSGGRALAAFPLAPMLSFSNPEAQIDRDSNFQVLSQIGARSFGYYVVNPAGRLLLQQTYDYGRGRPTLRSTGDGGFFVWDGQRRVSESDFPKAAPEPAKGN